MLTCESHLFASFWKTVSLRVRFRSLFLSLITDKGHCIYGIYDLSQDSAGTNYNQRKRLVFSLLAQLIVLSHSFTKKEKKRRKKRNRKEKIILPVNNHPCFFFLQPLLVSRYPWTFSYSMVVFATDSTR